MKHCLLDTNMLGYLAEHKAGIITPQSISLGKRRELLPPATKLFLCPITIGEIEYGLHITFKNDLEKLRHVRELMDTFSDDVILDINLDTAKNYYSEVKARLFEVYAPKTKKSRKRRIEEWKDPTTSRELQVDENDLWIAAVAMAHNLILVTDDKMNPLKKVIGADLEFANWLDGQPKNSAS